jgi:hypothetical protein
MTLELSAEELAALERAAEVLRRAIYAAPPEVREPLFIALGALHFLAAKPR